MSNRPKISVIMPVYNGEGYLKDSILSIVNQTFNPFEFIIVDDCSTDGSFEIIKDFACQHDVIKVIRNNLRLGHTKSLNKALRLARGEYVARQDADDISLPRRFEEQMKFFKTNPKTALLGTSIYIIDKNGRILDKKIASKLPWESLHKSNGFFHGSVIFRKAVVDELGGYNELFEMAEDYELWLRIGKRHPIRNLPSKLYAWRIHKNNVSLTKRSKEFLFTILARKTSASATKNDELTNLVAKCKPKVMYSILTIREKFIMYTIYIRGLLYKSSLQTGFGRGILNALRTLRRNILF